MQMFALQMLATAIGERIEPAFFYNPICIDSFKCGQAERVQTRKALKVSSFLCSLVKWAIIGLVWFLQYQRSAKLTRSSLFEWKPHRPLPHAYLGHVDEDHPTDTFTLTKPHNPPINVFELEKDLRSIKLEALKLCWGWSGLLILRLNWARYQLQLPLKIPTDHFTILE